MSDSDTDETTVRISVDTLGNQSAMAKAEETTQLDERRVATDIGRGIKPPYSPAVLASFLELNETHAACVRKKSRYEVGYGFEIVPHPAAEDPSESQRDALRDFWFGSDSRWKTGPEGTAAATPNEVLELARMDYHGIGWSALEITVDGDGTPNGLAHIPAWTVRVRKVEKEDGEVVRGHGYVQVRDARTRYFGEAGDRYADDPKFVDKETGEVAGDPAALENDPANELIYLPNPSPLALYYGVPDWVAAMQTMSADQAAKEWNHDIFDNLGIPYYAIKVTGGTLTDASKRELRELQDKLLESPYRTAILEVDEFIEKNDIVDENGNQANIEFEPIGAQHSQDMEFQAFRERNEHEIAKVHEVPPILINVTSTSNRSNSKEQVREFAQDVIAPEQAKFESRLYHILHRKAFDAPDWTIDFELRGADRPETEARIAEKKIRAVDGNIPLDWALEEAGWDPIPDDHPVDGNTLLSQVGAGDAAEDDDRPPDAPPLENQVGVREEFDLELDGPLDVDPRIDMTEFDSSNLRQGLYDRDFEELYIRFIGDPVDRIYVYLDVPESVWSALKTAESHGSYHYHNIRMDYVYEELTDTSGWPQIGA